MVRRIITVICIFFFDSIPGFQIGFIMNMSIIFAGNNIANKVFEDPSMNRIDAINELYYYLILVFSFSFTLYNSR